MRMFASMPRSKRLPWAAMPNVSTSTQLNPRCARQTRSSVASVTTAASARTCCSTSAMPMLATSSSATQAIEDVASKRSAGVAQRLHGGETRGHAALHVVRATTIELAVADGGREWLGHRGDADGVDVAVEQQRPPAAGAAQPTDDAHAARLRLVLGDLHA